MKTTLGWLAFGLSVAFAIGQYLGAVQCVWFPNDRTSVPVTFFGFGLPMVLLALFVAALWSSQPRLRNYLGWTSTGLALLWGVTLLALVGTWTGLFGLATPQRTADEWVTFFCGYLGALMVCGTGGVALLAEPSSNREEQSERTLGDTGRAMQSVKAFPQ